jgi:hypothetical protein
MRKKKLLVQEKFYRQAKFWRMVVALAFLLTFLAAFWGELRIFLDLFTGTKFKDHLGPPGEVIIYSYVKLFYNFIGIFFLFFIWALVVSQFVLPVQSNLERRLVFQRLLRYFFNLHGPAVSIEKGIAIADETEMQNTRPGVAFVDLCSAIALERQWEHVETGKDLIARLRRSLPYHIATRFLQSIVRRVSDFVRGLLNLPVSPVPLVRIAGPGIVFTNMNEKIRGIADLRRQFRNADARVTTRDGFEIQVPVSVIFTLGDKPEALYVTYDWDVSKGNWQDAARPSDIRVIKLNKARNRIERMIDDLDEDDQREIHQFVKTHLPTGRDQDEEFTGHDNPPYHFDTDRVFAALYSKALEATDSTPMPWTELPIHVAVEHLRNLIADEDYDRLYQLNNPAQFPLYERVLPEFRRYLRNQGVLSYQFVLLNGKKPFKVGDTWVKRDIAFYEPQDLKNSKVLRNRGIRVLASNFSEFSPKHAGVREQMVDQWRVHWEGEAKETATQAEMEALNTVAQARRTATREIISNLEMAYTGSAVPKDALVLHLMQTIEQALKDPKTQALLPKDGLAMLIELRNILHPGMIPPQPGSTSPRSIP